MSVSPEDFRLGLGRFASGVTVVTHRDSEGTRRGITVSAFTSVSLNPPLVLICIDRRATVHDKLKKDEAFAVNILADDQEAISRRFASKQSDPFEGLAYRDGAFGAPVLDEALASLECRITQALDGGDHTILLAQVESVAARDAKPLLYYRGGYAKLA